MKRTCYCYAVVLLVKSTVMSVDWAHLLLVTRHMQESVGDLLVIKLMCHISLVLLQTRCEYLQTVSAYVLESVQSILGFSLE